jgi:hypothetical protein
VVVSVIRLVARAIAACTTVGEETANVRVWC